MLKDAPSAIIDMCCQPSTAPLFLPMTGKRRYNIKIWKTFTDCFNCLPIAAIIDDKIFCCHGGQEAPVLHSSELASNSGLYLEIDVGLQPGSYSFSMGQLFKSKWCGRVAMNPLVVVKEHHGNGS